MAFNLTQWIDQVKQRLQDWAQAPQHAWSRAGAQTLFGYLATMTLFPLAEALAKRDTMGVGLTLGSITAGVGGNLIAEQVQRWKDRIDIHIEVPRVEYEKLSDDRLGEPSAAIRDRVKAARERQRFTGTPLLSNADMGPAEVREYCRVDDAGKSLLRAAMQQLHMSARACDELPWGSPHPQAGANHRRPGK